MSGRSPDSWWGGSVQASRFGRFHTSSPPIWLGHRAALVGRGVEARIIELDRDVVLAVGGGGDSAGANLAMAGMTRKSEASREVRSIGTRRAHMEPSG